LTQHPLTTNPRDPVGAPPAGRMQRLAGKTTGNQTNLRSHFGNAWQAAFAARAWNGRMPGSSATLSAQFWAEMIPWRMTAGWSMVAGMLATGVLQSWAELNWQTLILVWLLVDPLWGALWRVAGGRRHLLALKVEPTGDAAQPRLPYLHTDSPAAQLMRMDGDSSIPYMVRVALPTLLIALVVSGAIGLPALVATCLVALLTVGGWTVRRALHMPPLLLHAAVTVLMPWLLVLAQWSLNTDGTAWNASIGLAFFWTLHLWGAERASLWEHDSVAPWILGAAQAGILVVLVVQQTAVWIPVTALLLMPTWLRVLRKQPVSAAGGLAPWWLAAFLASALALGW